MQTNSQGFFESSNPRMIFLFGLVTGIVLTMIFGGRVGLSLNTASSDEPSTIVAVNDDGNDDNAAAAPTRTSTVSNMPPITEDDHIRGDVDSPLTWVEYSDFECPFCKRFSPTMKDMLDEYDGKIKLVYRHFPLSFHRPLALTEAEAAECANEFKGDDAFWQMHDFIFDTTNSNGNGMSEDELVEFATTLGIGESDFQTCLDDDRYVDHIEEDLNGGSAAGVTGTPGSIFIDADGNAQLVSGAVPFSSIQSIIDAALE